MNATCDAVGVTEDLRECLVETKEESSLRQPIGRLLLAIFASAVQLSVSDEQVLSLP